MTEKNRNLLYRVGSAFVLLPLIIWLILQGGLAFALLIAGATAVCAYELNALPGRAPAAPVLAVVQEEKPRGKKAKREAAAAAQAPAPEGFPGAAVASIGAAFLLPLIAEREIPGFTVKSILAALVMLALVDALLFEEDVARAPVRVGLAALGGVYPGLLLSALVPLRHLPRGEYWIVLTLVVTWFNDTGAYFAGRFLGRTKLYPRISPSKTWEGAAGGLAAAIAGALGVRALFSLALPWWGAVAIGAGASVLGPLGDLSESMLKRAFGAKDSGKVLPGHGGLLDRIDALLFTAPFVLFCARFWAYGG